MFMLNGLSKPNLSSNERFPIIVCKHIYKMNTNMLYCSVWQYILYFQVITLLQCTYKTAPTALFKTLEPNAKLIQT